MRRFLVLALTMALGLTALAATPAAAHSRGGGEGNDECTYVWTSEGRDCLTDKEIRERRKDDSSDRETRRHRKDDSSDRETRRHRKRDDRSYGGYQWLRYLDDRSSESCDCLSRWDRQHLSNLADDPDRRDIRRILWYLKGKDCVTDREFRRYRRAARNFDEVDIRRIIDKAAGCECKSDGRLWLDRTDIRRLDKKTRLDDRQIRRHLRVKDGQDCVSRGDVRRLDKWADDLEFWDILDWLD